MTFSTATIAYTVQQGAGASIAQLIGAMGAPPVPVDLLASIGVRLGADSTTSGSGAVTRTIQLELTHVDLATATPVMSGDGSVLESVTLTAGGKGYAALPIVKTTPGHSSPGHPNGATSITPATLDVTMKVVATSIVVPGSNHYTAPAIYFRGGLQKPTVGGTDVLSGASCVQALQLVNGGEGYSANSQVSFICDSVAPGGSLPTATLTRDSLGRVTSVFLTSTGSGLLSFPQAVIWDPGPAGDGKGGGSGAVLSPTLGLGSAATATLTLTMGSISGVTMTSAGGPYVVMPDVLVVDSTGAGAVIVPLMGLLAIGVVDGGSGWDGVPTIRIQDLFDSLFGEVSSVSAASAFWNLMKVAIETSVGTPVTSAAPVIA